MIALFKEGLIRLKIAGELYTQEKEIKLQLKDTEGPHL